MADKPRYYDRQGRPMSLTEWADRLEERSQRSYKVVEQTQVGPYWISTVWLGLDHNYSDTGPPLIFETLVFLRSGDEAFDAMWQLFDEDHSEWREIDSARYSTEAEAQAGHDALVAKWRRGGNPSC